jgi:hypothetical protein
MDNEHSDLSRRDFSRLSMAAFGGVVVGATGLAAAAQSKEEGKEGETSLLLQEPHVCCGLNTCKGKAVDKKNACAGQGSCATAEKHSCHGENACKGQGGCGEKPGENACKGKGECGVPLQEKTWKKARKNFEAAMKKADKKFGSPPKDCPKKA